MSTETLEAPALVPSDSEALKSSFNAAMKKEAPAEVVETEKVELKQEVKTDAKTDFEIPKELLQEKKEDIKTDEPEIDPAIEEIRAAIPKGKARESFAKMEELNRSLREKHKKEIEELKAKTVTTSTASPELESALKTERERAANLEKEFERVAYERSPKYQKFGNEEAAELKSAKSYLEGGDVNPAVIEAAANTSGAARLKYLTEAGLDAGTISIISPHLARIDAIRRERDASLEVWKQSHTQEEQQNLARQKQQQEAQIAEEKRIFTDVKDRFMKSSPAFQKVEGQDKWNAFVDQNIKEAEDFFHGRKPLDALGELGFRGVAQKTTELMNQELTRKYNELQTAFDKLKAAQPDTGKSHEVETKKTTNPTNPEDEYKSNFNSELAKVRESRG